MTSQVWPSSDDFADGASAYGTGVRRYLRVRPMSGVGDIAGFGIVPSVEGGELRRFWASAGSPANPSSVNYAAGFQGYGASVENAVSAAVERQIYIADGEVEIVPRVFSRGGTDTHLIQHCVGVCGRVQGGTLTTPGASSAVDEYIDQPNGYYFMQARAIGTAALPSLLLYRVVSGTWTLLESALLSAHESFTWGTPGGGAPRKMRMVIEAEGSDVRLRCYRVRKDSGPLALSSTSAPSEQLIFTHLDPSASAITTAGRWGCIGAQFADQLLGANGDYSGTVLFASLRIRNAPGTVVLLRDLWHRSTTWKGHVNSESAAPTAWLSQSLSMAYTGDMCGPFEHNVSGGNTNSAFAHVAHMIADTGNNRLVFGVDPEVAYPSGGIPAFRQSVGWYFSQDPAASTQQNRSVTMTFLSTVTSPREPRVFGIHLRASLVQHSSSVVAGKGFGVVAGTPGYDTPDSNTDSYKSGYRATIRYDMDGGSDRFTAMVWAHASLGQSTLLATADVTATLALGTEFKLGFEVRDFDLGPGGLDVAMKIRINDVDTALTLEGVVGVTVEAGWLVDRRAIATSSGLTVGMYGNIYPTHLASGLVHVNEFATEALTGGTGPPTPPIAHPDLGNIAVEGQSVNITPLANDQVFGGATKDTSSVVQVTAPDVALGTSTVNGDGSMTFAAAAGTAGSTASWTYHFSDSEPLVSNDAEVEVLIQSSGGTAQDPFADDDSATVVAGQSTLIGILANDQAFAGALIDPTTVVLDTSTLTHSTATVHATTGVVTFTSTPSAPLAVQTFSYTVKDDQSPTPATSNSANVSVLITDGSTPPPSSQPTVPVDAETATKTGTLTTPASWPINEERIVGINSAEFDTGHRATMPALPKERRMFSLQMLGATEAERATLSAFFLAHRGTEIPFDWVHPLTKETIAVRFSSANIAAKHRSSVGSGAEDYRFDLIEVFDAGTYGA